MLGSTISALQHVFLEVDTSECLADLLQCSKRLTSAHLSVGESASGRLGTSWGSIQLNLPGLKSLGLHWRQFERQLGSRRVLHRLNELANLEEFGIQLGDPDLNPANWEPSNGIEPL